MIIVPPNGLYFSGEGLDASGKNTQLNLLRKFLEEQTGKVVGFHSEPNDDPLKGTPIGRHIRKVLRGEEPMPENMLDFQRFYVVCRFQNYIAFTLPCLRKGGIWIADRFAHSTIAYGPLSGRPAETFINLHYEVFGPRLFRWPDMSLYLDIPAEESVARLTKRAAERGEKLEYFDKLERLKAVRENYLALTRRNDVGNLVVIDGMGTPEEVFERIKKEVLARFS